MTLISTSALRKITVFILVVAAVSFGAAEIHKRFFLPRQQAAISTPPPPSSEPTPTPVADPFKFVESLEGTFQRWEDVPNSSDKYAFLADPQTGDLFPKVRVGFEFSLLFGDNTRRADATVFAVEKGGEDYEVLGYLKDFTSEEIDMLIKPGDRIKFMLTKRIDEVGNVKDKEGNLLANWLFIKREGGKRSAEKEIGREIQSP